MDLEVKSEQVQCLLNKHGIPDEVTSLSSRNGYFTEKITDCMMLKTIPIYWGCSNINELIPDGCYVSINNMNMVDMVNTIKSVIDNESELYNQYLEKIKKLKQDFFINPKYNVWERIKLLINE